MSASAPVITGIGVVAPTGVGVAEHWLSSLEGTSRLGPVTSFDASALPVRCVGEVRGFDEVQWVEPRLRVQTDRWTWMALATARMALGDARLDPSAHEAYDLSVITASASGGNAFGQREIHALWSEGAEAVSAYQSIGWFYAASSGQISIRDQFKGACGVLVADAAGGLDAVSAAMRSIRRGTKAVLVGGTEAPLSPYALACQVGLPLSREADPQAAYRPFSSSACGYVPGEGGAMVVLEDSEFAQHRQGRESYARVLGGASTHDAQGSTGLPRDHRQLVRAMALAMQRAGVGAEDIDVVFADGAGVPELDKLEVAALREVFGARRVPVTVPKSMTGRLISGGAALDVAWAALALAEGVIPPTVCDESGEQFGIDLVVAPREQSLRHVLVVARGHGGFNSALVLAA